MPTYPNWMKTPSTANWASPLTLASAPVYWGPTTSTGSPIGTTSAAPSAGVTDYNPAYGGKPVVPSPVATAGTAAAGNIGNLGSILNLGGQYNDFVQNQLLNAYQSVFPDYLGKFGSAAGVVGNELAGQFSPDAINQMVNLAANRGITTGNVYGPGANAALLNMMGTNVTNLQRQGLGDFMNLSRSAPIAKQFDPASMFVTPDEIQNAAMAQSLYQSAPVPADAAEAAIQAAMRGYGAGTPAQPANRVNFPAIIPTGGFGGSGYEPYDSGLGGPAAVSRGSTSQYLTAGGLPVSGGSPNTYDWEAYMASLPGGRNMGAYESNAYPLLGGAGYFPDQMLPGIPEDFAPGMDLGLGSASDVNIPNYWPEPEGIEQYWPGPY